MSILNKFRGAEAQWVARLTRDPWIPVSREFEPHKGHRCFLEQEILLSLLSTGWFQELLGGSGKCIRLGSGQYVWVEVHRSMYGLQFRLLCVVCGS